MGIRRRGRSRGSAPLPGPRRAANGQAALREGDWKIHRGRGDSRWQLFNVAEDPGEERDLAAAQPDRVAALVAAWRKLDAEMVEPLWRRSARGTQ
jgi:arylsulfatase